MAHFKNNPALTFLLEQLTESVKYICKIYINRYTRPSCISHENDLGYIIPQNHTMPSSINPITSTFKQRHQMSRRRINNSRNEHLSNFKLFNQQCRNTQSFNQLHIIDTSITEEEKCEEAKERDTHLWYHSKWQYVIRIMPTHIKRRRYLASILRRTVRIIRMKFHLKLLVCVSYELRMKYIWKSWPLRHFTHNYIWISYEVHMNFTWNTYVAGTLISYELHKNFIRTSYEFRRK